MNFSQSIKTCLKKSFVFSGRASRSEFWYWTSCYIVYSIASFILKMAYYGTFYSLPLLPTILSIFGFFLFIVTLSTAIRRLHDTNRKGWFILIFPALYVLLLLTAMSLFWDAQNKDLQIPYMLFWVLILGGLMFWLFGKEGTKGPNRFGDDPLNLINGEPPMTNPHFATHSVIPAPARGSRDGITKEEV